MNISSLVRTAMAATLVASSVACGGTETEAATGSISAAATDAKSDPAEGLYVGMPFTTEASCDVPATSTGAKAAPPKDSGAAPSDGTDATAKGPTDPVGFTLASQLVIEDSVYYVRLQVGAGRSTSTVAVIAQELYALPAGSVSAGALTPAGARNVANITAQNASTLQATALRLFNAGRVGVVSSLRFAGSLITSLCSPTNLLTAAAFLGPIVIPMVLGSNMMASVTSGASREEQALRLMLTVLARYSRDGAGCRATPLITANSGTCTSCINLALYTDPVDVRNIQQACASDLRENRTVCALYVALVNDATTSCGALPGGYAALRRNAPQYTMGTDAAGYVGYVCPAAAN